MKVEKIGSVRKSPGQKEFGAIDLAVLPNGGHLTLPFHVITGNEEGPTLCLVATQHGNEITPLGVIKDFLKTVSTDQLAGTVIVVPVANPLAFGTHTRNTVVDGANANGGNLNRLWPGRPDGFITERIAHALWDSVLSKADYIIDFHNGTDNLSIYYSYVFGHVEDDVQAKSNELSQAFGMEILMQYPSTVKGSLTSWAVGQGVPTVTCELGDFYGIRRLNQQAETPNKQRSYLDVGLSGINNVMSHLGMVRTEVQKPSYQVRVGPETGIGPQHGGLLESVLTQTHIGAILNKGDMLGRVLDPFTFEELCIMEAPYSESIVVATSHRDPFAVVNPGGGDFGYYVADWSNAHWIVEKEDMKYAEIV